MLLKALLEVDVIMIGIGVTITLLIYKNRKL